MKTTFCLTILILSILFICSSSPFAKVQEPLDGPNRILKDYLLDNLVGDWKLTRKLGGRTSQSTVHAEWVLNHQFLFIHMTELSTPSQYEAMVYVGYDNASERFVAHWIDIFGGRFSETLGYGTHDGNAIKFNFEYPDGPFLNTLTWNPETKSWIFLMTHKDRSGKWVTFAEDSLRRS